MQNENRLINISEVRGFRNWSNNEYASLIKCVNDRVIQSVICVFNGACLPIYITDNSYIFLKRHKTDKLILINSISDKWI